MHTRGMTQRRWFLSWLGATAALAISLAGARSARADIGPIEPARKICMGSSEGSPCKIDGKVGTCQGPHPSRMYCTPSSKQPATPDRKPAPEPKKPVPPPDAAPAPAPTIDAAPPAPTPTPTPEPPPTPPAPTPTPPTPSAPAAPPTKPTTSSGCAVGTADASSAGLLLLGAVLALGGRRRRAAARR